jgi:hypothetical protein
MGHAGAIIAGGSGTASDKIAALNKVGVPVAGSPTELPAALKELMKSARKAAPKKAAPKKAVSKKAKAKKATVKKVAARKLAPKKQTGLKKAASPKRTKKAKK